ncbi:helix-turn-helix domain-containing protein [Kinneretia aquatilis]|uniref:helix-turn-helix domain-containing protein n=1 Tax=Kinneretia aquatilis TaxID=2070761 RepID=UPI001056E8BE|nr:helix-turn-helix transcriptional regulator [Paucibacter aquatile]
MKNMSVSKRKLAQLRTLCHAGLTPEAFVPALLEALHAVIPSYRNLFDWTDGCGRLLRYDIEGPVDTGIARIYFEHFHNRQEIDCMPAFESLRNEPSGVRGARALMSPRFFNSALYSEIWKPQQLHSRIEAVVRGSMGQLLGSLVLYRGPKDPDFSREDEQALATLLPWVARGLQAAGQAPGDEPMLPSPDGAEVLLLGPDGELRHASAGALRLLLLADQGLTPAAVTRPAPGLRTQLQRLLGPLLEDGQGPGGATSMSKSMTLINASGCVTAESQRLVPIEGQGSEPLMQISLRRMEPLSVALYRTLRRLPLSAAQIRVCAGLYRGLSSAEMAQELDVAPSTVVDHVRKAYRALDVRDAQAMRRELDARMQPWCSGR